MVSTGGPLDPVITHQRPGDTGPRLDCYLCEHERAIKPYGLEVSKTLRKDRRDSPVVEPET